MISDSKKPWTSIKNDSNDKHNSLLKKNGLRSSKIMNVKPNQINRDNYLEDHSNDVKDDYNTP